MNNGHVLLLDNGAHRRGLSYSRVVEVDPETNEIAWEYRGTPLNSFFTHFTGGAQRLANGNTLITEGANGRLFEVTPNGEVVWEYISPFFAEGNNGVANGVFRAHRYGPDDPSEGEVVLAENIAVRVSSRWEKFGHAIRSISSRIATAKERIGTRRSDDE